MATKNRDRKEVQQLIEMGKSKGFLTYEEVNDALPADMAAPTRWMTSSACWATRTSRSSTPPPR